nr:MAG TPA: hypothetical protein [Caudoviricetes sp.]
MIPPLRKTTCGLCPLLGRVTHPCGGQRPQVVFLRGGYQSHRSAGNGGAPGAYCR